MTTPTPEWVDPFTPRADLSYIPMCNPTETYKPIRYQWADDYWLQQKRITWLPDELSFGPDAVDYATLPENERSLLDNIFRLFTQSDVDVQNNYMTKYLPIFQDGSVSRMLYTFGDMEHVHVRAYSKLLDTVGHPDSYYTSFLEISEMRAKHDMLRGYTMATPREIAITLALVGGFGEGLQLFSSFAMLMNFPRFGKMKSMGQVVTWSIRDESLHVAGITRLFREFCKEANISLASIKEEILQGLQTTIMLEDDFIDRIHEMGDVRGYTPDEMKEYIRYVGDYRLQQLGYDPVYNIKAHPLGWLEEQLNGIEHANFFETRSTEYSNASTTGDWKDSYDRFDAVVNKSLVEA